MGLQGNVLRYRRKDESAASQAPQEQYRVARKLQEGSLQGGHLLPTSPEVRGMPGGNAQDLADVPSTPFQAAPVSALALHTKI